MRAWASVPTLARDHADEAPVQPNVLRTHVQPVMCFYRCGAGPRGCRAVQEDVSRFFLIGPGQTEAVPLALSFRLNTPLAHWKGPIASDLATYIDGGLALVEPRRVRF